MCADSTRAAALTPLSPAGVAVVGLIGPDAIPLLERVFRPRRSLSQTLPGASASHTAPESVPSAVPAARPGARSWLPDRLRLGQLLDGEEVIDDAIVAARVDEHGVGHVEFTTHGGPRIVQRLLLTLARYGATIVSATDIAAETWPADCTLDREVYQLLPLAQTRRAAAWLLRQREMLRAAIEEIPRRLAGCPATAAERIGELVDAYPAACRLLYGFTLAIVGPPNAGKSTLANAFCGRPRVRVSAEPGTTRDYVSEPVAIEGVPVTLVDTAGLRSAGDAIEAEAIRRARQQASAADLRLVVVDAAAPATGEVRGVLEEFNPDDPSLLVLNKADLPAVISTDEPVARWAGRSYRVSAAAGTGLEVLARGIVEAVGLAEAFDRQPAAFTERQVSLLRQLLSGGHPEPGCVSGVLREIVGPRKNAAAGV